MISESVIRERNSVLGPQKGEDARDTARRYDNFYRNLEHIGERSSLKIESILFVKDAPNGTARYHDFSSDLNLP